MQRRNPLQELPLEQFLPSYLSAKPIRGSKRPHSPGDLNLFSPAKRRIFESEGLLSPSKSRTTTLFSPSAKLLSPSRFSDVLTGPASPARVLDFGLPKNARGDPVKPSATNRLGLDATPPRRSSIKPLAPSPELKPRNGRITQNHDAFDTLYDDHELSEPASPPSSYSKSNFIFVPRTLPPRPDPTSIHYPGFVVFQDPHLVVSPPSSDHDEVSSDIDMENDKPKENMAPRKAKKVTTIPSGSVESDIPAKKSASVSDMPRSRIARKLVSLSPESVGSMVGVPSPTSRSHGARSFKRAMMDGLDLENDDE
ncbi:hypothetical protein NLJ89_g81 [Agrocybe chaxingu]|uniref:Uncharacterized protein n=1 Tax=Agrocybe chaxingu TaxID=84603 RepID=A0A9W8N2J2_9AGAR|nr:hypothetical protein NLJ89_g81 [Agrocybe chaxingu]